MSYNPTDLKYVRHDRIGFVLFKRQDDLFHSHIGDALRHNVTGKIVSAGFANVDGGEVVCWGESESLKMKSLPEDSALLADQLGLKRAR